jgi:hypothetical protein
MYAAGSSMNMQTNDASLRHLAPMSRRDSRQIAPAFRGPQKNPEKIIDSCRFKANKVSNLRKKLHALAFVILLRSFVAAEFIILQFSTKESCCNNKSKFLKI